MVVPKSSEVGQFSGQIKAPRGVRLLLGRYLRMTTSPLRYSPSGKWKVMG